MKKTDLETIHSAEHKQNVSSFFSGRANYWKKIYNQGEIDISIYYSYFMNKRKQAVLEALDQFSNGNSLKVLDVGCGAGVLLNEIVKRMHKATGIDLSREMIEQASCTVKSTEMNGTYFIQADLESLPFTDNSFDVVVCVGVLQYLQNDTNSIKELSRILRPNGIAIITIPNIFRINNILDPYYYFRGIKYIIYNLSGKIKKLDSDLDPSEFSTNLMFRNRRYYQGQLRNVFREFGLGSLVVKSIGFGPLTFWRKPIFTERLSLSLSDSLDRASMHDGMRWLNFFSNRWVISVQKVK